MNNVIETALAQRGLIPIEFTCAICKDKLHRDDCAKQNTFSTVYDYLHHKFGGHVCHGCADEYDTCEGCGRVHMRDDMNGDIRCNECAASDILDAKEEAEYRGWTR